ncbi:MAG: hypothetical protein P8129_15450 [Anaerolineae bacterium]
MNRLRHVVLAGLLLLSLAGCQFSGNALLDADQVSWDAQSSAALDPGQAVGQTFVARHGGLAGVEILLVPTVPAARSITLHLRAQPQAETDLATASLDLPAEAEAGFYRFTFPALADSHGQYYYAFLQSGEPGVSVALSAGDTYLDGAAYQDHHPLEAQTGFRLVYAPLEVALDLVRALWSGLGLLAATALLFVVPGWALLAWLWPGRPRPWAVTLGLAVGISLALYPLLLLWTDLVGLHLGAWYAWLPALLGGAALLWRYRRGLLSLPGRLRRGPRAGGLRAWARGAAFWPDLSLILVMGLLFVVRLLAVRSLDVPLWGDSYQHTMIVQLLIDNGGLFDSWAPYVPLDQFTYHFGFHAAAAALHWITGLPAAAATLWTGQLLNVLAVVALYPLAHRMAAGLSDTGRRWAGVVAVLFAGLLCHMPMTYTNWGRYTQLAGQAILPAAAWLTWRAFDEPGPVARRAAVIALVVSGLGLTHYRILLFYGCFVLGLFLVALRERSAAKLVRRLAGAGAGAMLLFFPWFWATFGTVVQQMFVVEITTPASQTLDLLQDYNQLGDLRTFLAPLGWLILVVGLGWGLWKRERGILLLALWWLVLLIVTNPAWFSLPGTGIISNFALFIAAYLPAAVATGYLAAGLLDAAGQRRAISALAVPLVLGLGLWGASQRMGDLDPGAYALATRPDLRAADWIDDNTPPESRFLINSFFAYGGTSPVGADGGWWLPLLAGRQVTVPPLTYGGEVPLEAAARLRIRDLNLAISESAPDDPDLMALLQAEGVTHVYVGQRQGRVNNPGPSPLDPGLLAHSANYRLIYHQDRVWIFEIVYAPPGQG